MKLRAARARRLSKLLERRRATRMSFGAEAAHNESRYAEKRQQASFSGPNGFTVDSKKMAPGSKVQGGLPLTSSGLSKTSLTWHGRRLDELPRVSGWFQARLARLQPVYYVGLCTASCSAMKNKTLTVCWA